MKKVNEVSKMTGVSKRTLQYYDLYYDMDGLAVAKRSKDKHRLYDERALEQVWKILVCRSLKFNLKEIKQFLLLTEQEQMAYLKHRTEQMAKQISELTMQIEFINDMQKNGIPALPSESERNGKTYVEYITYLKEVLFANHGEELEK